MQPGEYELNVEISMKVFLTSACRCISDPAIVLETTVFTLFQRNSMGLRSGE